jgi:ABC-2 type transport system permease protein
MKTIIIIIIKEFKQVFRNRILVTLIFMLPIVQLLILTNAATYEIKNIKLGIIDNDHTQTSFQLANKIKSANYFKIEYYANTITEADKLLELNKIDLYIHIPNNFERNLVKYNGSKLGITVNAIDGSKAGIASNYIINIITNFQSDLINTFGKKINLNITGIPSKIIENYYLWYNVKQDYKIFIVPGLLVLLVSIVGIFLTAINIVREKEIGTIEQINVTPIRKIDFVIGKLAPFWILGMFVLIFGLLISRLIYHIPLLGSPFVILTFASIYMVLVLGIGLFISTISKNQQQAILISWFFILVFNLISGLFTPIENMPSVVQAITYFNPFRYFIEVIRLVMLKGSGFEDIKFQLFMTIIYAILINFLSVLNYHKKTS